MKAMLEQNFAGAAVLREQLASCRVQSSCDCGCGSLRFFVGADEVDIASGLELAPIEAEVTNAGTPLGGVILFLVEGRLYDLDVHSFGDPMQVPEPAAVTWLCRS